uniref:Large ribosomal subunit protein uL23c n=1 Tax=Lepocinclis steinii TaxID=459226 RepID=A0A3G3LLP1_9EUGL|nr:ribosomal protein L23 [Lepocinclis steinii]AYQ93626.1 ribosomal protein L23 [Lepocinclis steinii]
MNQIDLIKYPVFSDKSKKLLKMDKYVFLVDVSINKTLVKDLIEKLFTVNVLSINSSVLPSKKRGVGRVVGYKSNYKRVILTLLRIYFIFRILFCV